MKYYIIAILLFVCSYDGLGQVINGDFEEWDGDAPVGWRVGGLGTKKSEDSYSGKYSVHIYSPPSNYVFLDNNVRPQLLGGWRIPKGANQISCWYKGALSYQIEAFFDVIVGFYQDGIKTKEEESAGLDSTYKWKSAVLCKFPSVSDSTNDSIALTIWMASSGPIGYFSFDIDGVKFDTVVKSVPKNGVSTSKMISIFPNPVKNIAYANYSVSEPSYIQTFLYSVEGKKLKELSSAESVYGSGRIPLDLYDIPNGLYYILCRINGEVITKP